MKKEYHGIAIQIGSGSEYWEDIEPTFHRVEEGTASELAQLIANATKQYVRMCYISDNYWKTIHMSNTAKDVAAMEGTIYRYKNLY